MINLKCDRCGKCIPFEESRLCMFDVFGMKESNKSKSELDYLNVSTFRDGKLYNIDLCTACKTEVYGFIFYPRFNESEEK